MQTIRKEVWVSSFENVNYINKTTSFLSMKESHMLQEESSILGKSIEPVLNSSTAPQTRQQQLNCPCTWESGGRNINVAKEILSAKMDLLILSQMVTEDSM